MLTRVDCHFDLYTNEIEEMRFLWYTMGMKTFLFVILALSGTTPSFADSVKVDGVPNVEAEIQQYENSLNGFADTDELPVAEITNDEALSASADGLVNPENVKAMGRGILNRKTGALIQLLCVGPAAEGSVEPSCDQVAFYELNTQEKNGYKAISKVFRIQHTKKGIRELRLAIRHEVKDYRRYNRNGAVGFYGVAMPVFLGTGYLAWHSIDGVAVSAATAGTYLMMAVPLISFVLIAVIGTKFGPEIFDIFHLGGAASLLSTQTITGKFEDQKGWSWSGNPKEISDRKYAELRYAISQVQLN
jgi:hypothetical protein